MNEEAIKHAFDLFVRDGYNGDINKFQKLLATNPRALEYSFKLFEKDGYKDGPEKYKLLMGLNQVPYAPQKSSIQSETATTTTEPTKTEVVAEEPVKELSNKPLEVVKAQGIPQKEAEMPTADTTKMPPMVVREAEPEVKEEPKKEMPIGENLLPVTEKTEVKAVETPSDKMVIKSEKKEEEPKGIPSYDDLGINPEKDPGSFLGATTDKNVKFEKMSPAELIGKDIFKNRGFDIKLERNKSLRYPDPPGTVFKKEKVGEREVYSSYDKANDKWYIYDEKSNKDNWTEVKAGPIKTLLNSKYKENNKIIDSKIDYNSEEENNKISKIKEGILLNKYLPYVIKNWDNLSNEQKEDLKLDFADSSYYWLIRKNLERNDPNLEFWVDVNNKLIGNQAISSNIIDVYDDVERKIYKTMMFEIPQLNKDIKEGKYKFLKSVAGDVLYDEKNDIFYHGDSFKENELKREEGVVNIRTIPKGTPAYDKIKSSLSKYNK